MFSAIFDVFCPFWPVFDVVEAREPFKKLPGGGTLLLDRIWARGDARGPESDAFSWFSLPFEVGWWTCWVVSDHDDSCWGLMTGDWWLMSDHWWLLTDEWWLMTDHWLLMTDDCWLMNEDWWLVDDDWWWIPTDDLWVLKIYDWGNIVSACFHNFPLITTNYN